MKLWSSVGKNNCDNKDGINLLKSFVFSKFTFNNLNRTKSAFDNTAVNSSNWWIIPKVRQRWNFLISGDEKINYKQYLVSKYLINKKN